MAATKKVKAAKKQTAVSEMKNSDELQAALIATQCELIEAKQSHAARELANTHSLKEQRKRIARIKTALNNLDRTEEKP